MSFAPIVLTVYKRPWHTEKTLMALKNSDLSNESILYIYSDGPKEYAVKEDIDNINKVREILRKDKWCKEVNIIESEKNIGLVRSFVSGINNAIEKYGKVIVLEDDQIVALGFLKYMNKALDLYENDKNVMHISAYMYPAKFISKQTTFFLNVQSCPGWGTWKRAWNYYNDDAQDHVKYFKEKDEIKKFDLGGYAKWFLQLEKNVEEPGFSFAVKWYASCYRNSGLSLFPSRSLIQNIGLDGTGEHCKKNNMYDVVPVDYLEIERIEIKENINIRKQIGLFYMKYHKASYKEVFYGKFIKKMNNIRSIVRWAFEKIYPELNAINAINPGYVSLLQKIKNSKISEKSKISGICNLQNVIVGDYTYISQGSIISNTTIGSYCSIGPNLLCGWGVHSISGISTSPMFYSTLKQNGKTISYNNKVQERIPINIGSDVFIGMNVTIIDGVKIGDGAVIGAGCIVSKDVPPYAIVVGSPMKILKYRFDEITINRLMKIKWWEWPDDRIVDIEKYFYDIEKFLNKYDK